MRRGVAECGGHGVRLRREGGEWSGGEERAGQGRGGGDERGSEGEMMGQASTKRRGSSVSVLSD